MYFYKNNFSMAVFVSLILQPFSANVTTIIRFGKEAKDYISSIDKEWRTEARERESKRERQRERERDRWKENSV